MPETTFETALASRTTDMIDACTRCGKCVEVCPVTAPAGVGDAAPTGVIAGVIDILGGGEGTAAAQAWAKGCVSSGDCIEACPESINPRFLLAMTRVALNRKSAELRDVRDLVQLLAQGRVEPRMAMAVHVAPQAADGIEIFAAVDVDQGAPVGPFDDERFVLGHLREGMPDDFAVPSLEVVERGSRGR